MKLKEKHTAKLRQSTQVARFIFLYLILGNIASNPLSHSLSTTEEDSHLRLFKNGDAIIGGLITLHEDGDLYKCKIFQTQWIGHVEAILYAIEKINKNKDLLPNITLGYDIRDICNSEIIAARYTYQFASASTMNCKAVRCMSHHSYICDVSGYNTSIDNVSSSKNYSTTYPVVAIVGKITSQIAIPLANFLQALRMPYIGTSATSEQLSSPQYDNIFRTIPPDIYQAKAFADIIKHFNWRYIVVVADDDSYGHYGVRALERESNKRKSYFCIKLVGYIPKSNYNEKLKTIVSSLKRLKTVRVIIVWCYAIHGKSLLMEATKQGLRSRVWLVSETLAMMKPEYLSSIPDLSSTGIHIGVKVRSEVPQGFLQNLQNKLVRNHSENEDRFCWNQFWKSEVSANDFSNDDFTTDDSLKAVYDDYVVYVIDAVYSIAHALDRMLRCKYPNGSDSMDKHLCFKVSSTTIQPDDLIEYLRNVEFQGVTGKVQFDSRGDRVEANYDVVYFDISNGNNTQKITKNVIGRWSKNSEYGLNISDRSIRWKNDKQENKVPSSTCTDECKPGQRKVPTTPCCWECLPCADGSISKNYGALECTKCSNTQMTNFERTLCQQLPITNIDWSDTLSVVLIILSTLGIVIDGCVFGIFFVFRDTPIVKALNKVCTFVLLLGIDLSFVMTLLYIAKPSSTLCSVLKPLRYIIYTLCCSALFLKTMQIVHAFNISGVKNWVKALICSTKRQVIVLSLIISIEVLLGAGWIFIDPPYIHVTIFPKSHVFITCSPFKGTTGQVFDTLMLCYLVLMAGCCIYYAYRARNLPAHFNEAKHISFSLYTFLLSWITYYPIEYAVEGWYVAVLAGASLLLSSYGLVGCIFGPKVYIIIRHPENNTADFLRAEMRHNNVNQSVRNGSSVRPIETSTY